MGICPETVSQKALEKTDAACRGGSIEYLEAKWTKQDQDLPIRTEPLVRFSWMTICPLALFLNFVYFLLFRATPAAFGSPRARGQIEATAADLHHSHSNVGSLTH